MLYLLEHRFYKNQNTYFMLGDRNNYLRKISVWMVVAIVVIWLGVYQIIITGAFSRSFWASIIGVQHSAMIKHAPTEKLTLKH